MFTRKIVLDICSARSLKQYVLLRKEGYEKQFMLFVNLTQLNLRSACWGFSLPETK